MRLALRILLILTLLLLVAFSASRRLRPRSAGIDVGLPADSPTLGCSDLMLTISKHHSVKINYDPVPLELLSSRLKRMYDLRYRRVLLVRADADVSFREVMRVIDVAQGAVSNLEPALLTPRAEKTSPCVPVEGPSQMD